jgi:predicted DNA-binding ribbon-helix-helix protein
MVKDTRDGAVTSVRRSQVFTGAQYAALESEADAVGITVADLVRRIIDDWRKRK